MAKTVRKKRNRSKKVVKKRLPVFCFFRFLQKKNRTGDDVEKTETEIVLTPNLEAKRISYTYITVLVVV